MSIEAQSIILHLNGWPGSGKLTIARLLVERMRGRLVDNHTLLNPAEALFERSDPLWEEARRTVRKTVLSLVEHVAAGVPIVLTDALSDDAYDSALFDEYRALATARSARLVSVILDCSVEENLRRLQSGDRAAHRKLTRPDILINLRARYRLLRPLGAEVIEVDVSELEPQQAADLILGKLGPQLI